MSSSATQPQVEPLVLSPSRQTIGAIVGIALFVAALFVVLSLIVHDTRPGLVGSVGVGIEFGLTFVLGEFGAFAAPFALVIIGASFMLGRPLRRAVARSIALLCAFLALSCMISLAFEGTEAVPRDDERAFALAGVVAEFIIHPKGLGLSYLLGTAGAWLACSSFLAMSVLLSTDFLFMRRLFLFVPRWIEEWREQRAARKARSLMFRRMDRDTVFGLPKIAREGESAPLAGIVIPDSPKAPSAGLSREALAPGGAEAREARQPDLFQPSIEQAEDAIIRRKRPARASGKSAREQEDLDLFSQYQLPPLSLMSPPPPDIVTTSKDELQRQAALLEKKLMDFRIEARVTKITQGPVITRFELKPAPGIKLSSIAALENDLAMALAAVSVRILAPIPGKDAVGIEAPNAHPSPVFLREIMESDEFLKTKKKLPFCLGKTIAGQPTVEDLTDMPHLLIAGTTGSGKSVCLNAVICSFLMRYAPDELKFIMIDPKRVELNVYQDIPHLLAPVVNDPRRAAGALNWLVEQMENRYKLLAACGVRNIDGYNALFDPKDPSPKIIGQDLEPLPRIIVVIDELADLMMVARNDVEEAIIRLAQLARAVGIHLIVSTQRPSVNVITGIIKANFPARIAFQVSSNVDSRTILDMKGAESLVGKGDMLYMSVSSPRPERLQGCYVSDKEVELLADFIRSQQRAIYVKQDFKDPVEIKKEARAQQSGAQRASAASRDGAEWEVMGQMMRPDGQPMEPSEIWSEYLKDDLFRTAAKLVLQTRKASVSLIQRRLKVGFARSGRLMDMMEEVGLVGPHKGSKPRDFLIDPVQYLNLIAEYEADEEEEE